MSPSKRKAQSLNSNAVASGSPPSQEETNHLPLRAERASLPRNGATSTTHTHPPLSQGQGRSEGVPPASGKRRQPEMPLPTSTRQRRPPLQGDIIDISDSSDDDPMPTNRRQPPPPGVEIIEVHDSSDDEHTRPRGVRIPSHTKQSSRKPMSRKLRNMVEEPERGDVNGEDGSRHREVTREVRVSRSGAAERREGLVGKVSAAGAQQDEPSPSQGQDRLLDDDGDAIMLDDFPPSSAVLRGNALSANDANDPTTQQETAPSDLITQEEVDRIVTAVLDLAPGVDREVLEASIVLNLPTYGFEVANFLLEQVLDIQETALRHPDVAEANGDGSVAEAEEEKLAECGCCFERLSLVEMAHCANEQVKDHLFCQGCLCQYAAHQLGAQDPNLKCLKTSGCDFPFPTTLLRQFLPEKLFSLFERLKLQKDLKDADIDGLEECPFCEWACIMDAPVRESGLFSCGNVDGCGVISCRICKKRDHSPQECESEEKEGRLAIEEAMSNALMRSCPNCKSKFVKEGGCNKMACRNCRTFSCYVCRKAIDGYEHFDQNRSYAPRILSGTNKCPLYDNVEERHDLEVNEAYTTAVTQYGHGQRRKLDV